jgi:transcription elongation regulator 1
VVNTTTPAPTGHTYYYHVATSQSTYTRPLPSIPVLSDPNNTSGELKERKKKKEKPAEKVPIPGTEWLKVTTNMGNIFWTHTGRKESVWTVPDEIKVIVEQMEREGQERIHKQEAEVAVVAESRDAKRKAEEKEHESRGKAKRPKIEEPPESPKPKASAPGIDEDEPAEDEDESWQRQMAEGMAIEEEPQASPATEPAPPKMTKAEATKQIFDVPVKVDISLEEGKALFKVCFSVFFPILY